MFAFRSDVRGLDRVLRDMDEMVAPARKRWIYGSLIRKALSLNRQRIREQKNLDGTPYQERKDGTGKKMFKRILRGGSPAQVKISVTQQGASVKAVNPVAAKHQLGVTERITAKTRAQLIQEKGHTDSLSCTKRQAEVLKHEVGFKKSIGALQRTFSRKTAGAIIRKHREKLGISRYRSWEEKRPKRDILGFARGDIPLLIKMCKDLIIQHSFLKKK